MSCTDGFPPAENGGGVPEEAASPVFAPQPQAQPGRVDVRDAGETVSDLVRAALAEASQTAAQHPAAQGAAAYAAHEQRLPDLEAPIQIVEDVTLEPLEVDAYTSEAEPEVEDEPEAELEPELEAQAEPKPAPRKAAASRRAPTRPAPEPVYEQDEAELDEDAAAIVAELRHAGVEASLAEELVREVELHVTPFADPAPLRDLVRSRIAAEIRVAGGWAAGGRDSHDRPAGAVRRRQDVVGPEARRGLHRRRPGRRRGRRRRARRGRARLARRPAAREPLGRRRVRRQARPTSRAPAPPGRRCSTTTWSSSTPRGRRLTTPTPWPTSRSWSRRSAPTRRTSCCR